MSAPSVSICTCTYKRNAKLRALLQALDRLDPATPVFEVVIADNDEGCGAESLVAEELSRHNFDIFYDVEPRRNIAHARNHVVDMARAPWLALIDDDEQPTPEWLIRHLRAAETYNADVVMGPTLPEYPKGTPSWVIRGRFFERPRRKTGEFVPYMRTLCGNVLLKSELVHARPGPFDPAYGLSGGEDTEFFEWLRSERGAKIVWCDEAEVYERIEPDRMTVRWLVGRELRGGQTFARQHLARRQDRRGCGVAAQAALTLRAIAFGGAGLVMLVVTAPLGRDHQVYWLRKIASQFGKLAALTRWVMHQY